MFKAQVVVIVDGEEVMRKLFTARWEAFDFASNYAARYRKYFSMKYSHEVYVETIDFNNNLESVPVVLNIDGEQKFFRSIKAASIAMGMTQEAVRKANIIDLLIKEKHELGIETQAVQG